MERREEITYIIRWINPNQNKDNYRGSPQRVKGVSPTSGALHPEDEHSEHLIMKVSRAYFWETLRTVQIGMPLLSRGHENLSHPRQK